MARYPGAVWKKITAKSRARMRWYRRVNLHVAVSEASSLFGYFNQKGIADSHFYVRKDGTVEQMVDTAYQAYADLQGNDATISIETQGGLRNAQGEKWTAAQVESLAQIYAWAVKTHGIPLKLAKDSIPTGTSSHGLSWHRLGIDGNFPGGILRGRVAGGMHYSRSRGKVCPGNAKIRQVDDVYNRARAILGGAGSPAPSPAPSKPKPAPKPTRPAKRRNGPSGQGKAATKSIQRVVRRTGDYTGRIDGDYGPMTRTAVRSYQSRQNRLGNSGLLVDGDWGNITRSWLNWVKKLQRALPKFKGVSKLRVDGDYGSLTSNAVRVLQSRNGLYVDGVAGPKTVSFMKRAGSKVPNRP